MPDFSLNFVSRIRGARDIHQLTPDQFRVRAEAAKVAVIERGGDPEFTLQERFTGETVVKPYYDYDVKFEDVLEGEDLESEKNHHLRSLKKIVEKLHPGKRVLYAQRHGPLDGKGTWKWKISYRAFVLGVSMVVTDIPLHIRKTFNLKGKETHPFLDLSVYKVKEQLVGVIYACKDIDSVKRYLVPLDDALHPNVDVCNYLVQHVDEDAEKLVPAASSGPAAVSGKKSLKGANSAKGNVEGAKGNVEDVGEMAIQRPEKLSGKAYEKALRAASTAFGKAYRLHDDFSCFDVDKAKRRLRVVPEEKWCFIRLGKHQGNHQFISIDERGARYCCHDEECREAGKKRDDLLIPWKELPAEVRELYGQTFPDDIIDADMLEVAKSECQKNITDTWPNETGLDIRRQQAMLTACAKQQRCGKCDAIMAFEQSIEGLRMRCTCGELWPPWGYITVPKDKFPGLQSALNVMQMNIGMVVNGDLNINLYGAGSDSADDICATYEGDGLVVFQETEMNQKFLVALRGTDDGLSELVFLLFRDEFHCVRSGAKGTDGMWYRYREHHWEDKAELFLKKNIAADPFMTNFRQAANFYDKVSKADDHKKKARAVHRLCELMADAGRRKRIIDDAIIRFHDYRPDFSDRLDAANMLAFSNGVFDFSAMEFRDGRREDYLSIQLDIPYQPMDQDSADCAFVMDFMTTIQPDQHTRDYLLKLLSLCLTTDTSMQYFWIFTGGGANGKSKLMNLLTESLGDHAGAAPAALLTRKREDANQANESLSQLEKARVAIFSEGASSEVINVSTVKLFTGEDAISTRGLHEKQRRWKPKFKCILVCNDIPRLDENTWAGWRRFKVVPFDVKFVDNPRLPNERAKDPTIGERLSKCRAAFISILVHFLQRFKTEGLIDSTTVREATQKYQTENDVLEEFCEEEIVADAGAALKATEVQAAFTAWASRKGRRLSDKKKVVRDLLCEKFGGEPKVTHGHNYTEAVRGWRGYRLQSD